MKRDHLTKAETVTVTAIEEGVPTLADARILIDRFQAMIGDGGAMYTLQALWTQAREALDVTTVIFANRSYAILNIELARVGAGKACPKAFSMLDLHNPVLDWVKLASGMGVEASRASTVEEFASQFGSAMKNRGPRLVEVVL